MTNTSSAATSKEIKSDDLEPQVAWPTADPQVKSAIDLAEELADGLYQQLPLSRSVEMRAAFYQTLLAYIKQITKTDSGVDVSRSFKAELAAVLEGFARVLRSDSGIPAVESQAAEVEELRRALVETKDKIITLLTERAKDQVHIARLETEIKLLPEMQTQADRVASIVDGTSGLQEELTKVRFELNKAHLARMRSKLHRRRQRNRSWWHHLRSQFLPEEAE